MDYYPEISSLPDCLIEKMIAAVYLADRWQGCFLEISSLPD
jgi:hypothetical protein